MTADGRGGGLYTPPPVATLPGGRGREMLRPRAAAPPIIRSISSVAFAIAGDRAFERALGHSVDWLRRINPAVPTDAKSGEAFEIGGGGDHPARSTLVEFDGGRMWSAIVDNPDSSVLGRTWVTEIMVGESATGVHFGTRLLNVTRGEDEPFSGSIPGIVRQVVADLPCGADGIGLDECPSSVNTAEALDALVRLLESPARRLPVVVVAQAGNHPQYAPPRMLARRLAGAAHVFEIDEQQGWGLTAIVGRQLSTFDGAARIYAPGFTADADPYEHPLWITWPNRTAAATGAAVIDRVLAMGLSRGTAGHPRFEAVRQAAAAHRLDLARPDATHVEMMGLYEEENSRLVAQLEELRTEQNQWLEDAERERASAARIEAELRADVARHRMQNDALRTALKSGTPVPSREPLTDLASFGEWAERNLSPGLWFAPKALKVAERGQYREPTEIGEALYLLDELFVSMKREPGAARREAFDDRLLQLGLENTPCFTQRGDIQRFPAYGVTYRGQKLWCDWHIKSGGGGGDPRQMFRIYYHWHEEDQVVLIGHLPSHLANNQTN